ncbi:DUF3426 domain-containing protein [Achromobacter sp.]|uniref:DUF3426 domain-containing protein n=1 Tax=Achromobacter sp. TaxID=134375 RepID=UPI0028B1FCB4|nr:DUF3426 domain-containing protein [Achromobacter sp.]
MALTTRCPQCGTSFKVVPDQLRVRNGLVRCGACSTVFDGRACLLPAPGAPVAPVAPATAPLPSSAAAVAAPVLSAPEPHPPAAPVPAPAFTPPPPAEPRVILPWDEEPEAPPPAVTDPPAAVTAPPPARTAPPPAPTLPPAVLRGRDDMRRRAEPEPAFPDDDRLDDTDDVDDDEPYLSETPPSRTAPMRSATYRSEPIVASRSPEPDTGWNADHQHDDVRDAERDDEYENEDEFDHGGADEPILGDTRTRYSSATDVGRAPPEFLDQDRLERHGLMRKLWGYACLIGLVALGLQLLYVYRTDIANSVPVLRPVLEVACKPFDCTVGYARRRDLIAISSSSLQPPAGAAAIDDGRTRLVLNLELRNRYDKPQHWPALVLELNDLSDTVVVRKVLMPENYLTPEQLSGPFGPQGVVKISVPIEVTGVQVNGYQTDKFFP